MTLWALVCLVAPAQTPGPAAYIDVSAPALRMYAGETMQLAAVVRDAAGNARTSDAVSWRVAPAAAASISQTGLLTPKTLAVVRVTAFINTMQRETWVQVLPKRLEITPSAVSLGIGEKKRVEAIAYDVSNKPVAGLVFDWLSVQLQQDWPNPASNFSVSANGELEGLKEGPGRLLARFNYRLESSGWPPVGMAAEITASVPVEVSAPAAYELRRVLHARLDAPSSYVLRQRPTFVAAAPDGGVLFNASLSGLSNALVSWRDGAFTPLLTAGTLRPGGGVVRDVFQIAASANGRILVSEATVFGDRCSLGEPGELRPLVAPNLPVTDAEALIGCYVTPSSLAETGWFVFAASYRLPGTNLYHRGLFRGRSVSTIELIASAANAPPELEAGAFDITNLFGIANDGAVTYALQQADRTFVYRVDLAGSRQLLVATGSMIAGGEFGKISGSQLWVDSTGGVLLPVQSGAGRQPFLAILSGDGSGWRVQPVQGLDRLLAGGAGGAALFTGEPERGNGWGVWLWREGRFRNVLLFDRTQIDGGVVTAVDSGALDAEGRPLLILRTSKSPMLAVRFEPDARVLFGDGDPLNIQAPLNPMAFVRGARDPQAPPLLVTGGTTGSIAELTGSGLRPRLTTGAGLGTGAAFFGAGSFNSLYRSPAGDLYLSLAGGIGRLKAGGTAEMAQAFPMAVDGLTYYPPWRVLTNSAGDLLWETGTSAGDQRVVLTAGSAHVPVLARNAAPASRTRIGARTVFGWDDLTLDGRGRILALVRFEDTPARAEAALFESGEWRVLARPGDSIGGRQVEQMRNVLAAGNRLYLAVQHFGWVHTLAEWTGQSWNPVVRPGEPGAYGHLLAGFHFYDTTTTGDVLYFAQQFPFDIFGYIRGGRHHALYSTAQPAANGERIVSVLGADIRDNGTVYILGLNGEGDVVIYTATPRF